MFLATLNKPKQLLYVCYIDDVLPEHLIRGRADMVALLGELSPGFRVLVDLSHLKFMNDECFAEIGAMMDRIDRGGVGLVVRVIPDPSKDIGMNIMSIFHYPHRPRIVTCQSMTEAAGVLEL